MGTRSNLYKQPSITYKQDLSLSSALQNLLAYNIATGNAPRPGGEQLERERPDHPASNTKRRRCSENRTDKRRVVVERDRGDDGPMTHQDYIDQKRREVESSRTFESLSSEILQGNSSSILNLVNYGSDDESVSSELEEKEQEDPSGSDHSNEVDRTKTRSEQRYPMGGEPVCVVCGKYGEYICNETDDDICSLECKAELMKIIKHDEGQQKDQKMDASASRIGCALPIPDLGEDTWDYNRNRWSTKRSNLCTYECWKCQRPGHLAEDCLVTKSGQLTVGENKSIPRELLDLYKRCHRIGENQSGSNCNTCRSSLSLATCLKCSTIFCDNAGHLDEHIRSHPSHQQYYSHKIKRLVKCCKSICKVTNIKELLACHFCFDKAFDKFYDMYTASWKSAGLSIISGSICCEDHFEWHRINCPGAGVEDQAYIVTRNARKACYRRIFREGRFKGFLNTACTV